jgi:hypothetical protein
MGKKYKIATDLIGLLISVVSILLLFIDDHIVIGSFIVAIFFILLLLLYYHLRLTPLKWVSIYFYYQFLDRDAKQVFAQKIKKFIPREKNIEKLIDRRISSTGNIINFKTNIGKITEEIDEGGTHTIVTNLSAPLKVGKMVEHKLSYIGIKCFEDNDLSITYDCIHQCQEAGIIVRFNKKRPPVEVKAYLIKETTIDCTDEFLTKDQFEYSFIIKKPKIGSRLLLQWKFKFE